MRRTFAAAAVLALAACQPAPADPEAGPDEPGSPAAQAAPVADTPAPVRDVDTTDVPPPVRIPERAQPARPGQEAVAAEPPAPVRDVDTTDVPPPVRVPEHAETAACAARDGRAGATLCVD